MREAPPADMVHEAAKAIGGVCDLLMFAWKPNNSDMHGVDPENLFYLLDTIRRDLDQITHALSRKAG